MDTVTHPQQVFREAELKPIPTQRGPFELWARLRKSSKYYRSQGLNEAGKPIVFPITTVNAIDHDGFCFRGRGNVYRAEDLSFCIMVAGKLLSLGGAR